MTYWGIEQIDEWIDNGSKFVCFCFTNRGEGVADGKRVRLECVMLDWNLRYIFKVYS